MRPRISGKPSCLVTEPAAVARKVARFYGLHEVIASAHNLACILWAMVKHRCPYDPKRLGNPELHRARKECYLRRQAEQLGFNLPPVEGDVS